MRRSDFVPFNYVDRSLVGPRPATEGMGLVVPICSNGGVISAPVMTINSAARVVSARASHTIPPVAAFRVRHDAGALSLLGNCIQSSSKTRYSQGWEQWVKFILLYFGTSDFL